MTVTCKAEESLTCSCVDVGTIIDGSDCSVDIHQTYANKAEAEAALNRPAGCGGTGGCPGC